MNNEFEPTIITNNRGNICVVTPNKTKAFDKRGNEIQPLFYQKREHVFLLKDGNVFTNKKWKHNYRYLKNPQGEEFRAIEKKEVTE